MRRALWGLSLLLLACGGPRGLSAPGTLASEDITRARQRAGARAFAWQPWSKETFERARREGKFILLDGAAEWCHWCHVMDETTYQDAEVGRLLAERFVAIRVDVDQRPDVAARYEDWGWPATVLFTPQAEELGKYRGYLPVDKLLGILREALAGGGGAAEPVGARWPVEEPAAVAALRWVGARVARDLDRRYDEEEGGWGGPQKAPLSANIEFELLRRQHGDQAAGARAAFTLRKQRALIDPVWGGMYQYSVRGTWDHPHYEKLLPVQTAAIEAYARAAQVLGPQEGFAADAARIAGYLGSFLRNRDGAFLVSQDADVGAHDAKARFVDGHVYYARDDAGRRQLGMPRIDDKVYARENGLAIAALCTLFEVNHDPALRTQAVQAAERMLAGHVDPSGAVRREAGDGADALRYLVDAAALGRGLGRLAQITGEARYREVALRVARSLLSTFQDPATGLLYVSTADPAAVGVFARRRQPFAHNVLAARALLLAARLGGAAELRTQALRVLAALSTPQAIDDEGRMTGEYLLALAEGDWGQDP